MKRTVKELVLEQFKFGVTKPSAIYKALNGFAGRASIYSAFAQLKKEGKITKTPKGYVLTPVNKSDVAYEASKGKTAKRKYTKRKAREQKEVNSEYSLSYIKKLEFKVVELHQSVEELTAQNTALKIDLLDQTAIINYLEKKLGV